MKNLFLLVLALILTIIFIVPAEAQTVFTHRVPESATDLRFEYEIALLTLSLEKTRAEYGDYKFEKTPNFNITRAINGIRWDSFPNFIVNLTYDKEFGDYPEMTYIRFPSELGLLSYRTCFTSTDVESKLAKVTTIEELRKFTIGQGKGWTDNVILRHNGFNVIEFDSYDALFKMTAAHRFDLFCRGLNEVKNEYEQWKDLKGLVYDKEILLYYPMPLFFFTNSKNKLAIERITKGLKMAYADGSMQALWQKHQKPNLDFAQVKSRKLFRLENPFIKDIDFDFARYNVDITKQ